MFELWIHCCSLFGRLPADISGHDPRTRQVVTPYSLQKLVAQMRVEPFAIAIDGSNDCGVEKMNPLTVHIFHGSLLSSSWTSACLHRLQQKACLPQWVSMDNTAKNMGKRNSIMTRVAKENPSVYVMGCPCHMVHNTAVNAADVFELVSVWPWFLYCFHFAPVVWLNVTEIDIVI